MFDEFKELACFSELLTLFEQIFPEDLSKSVEVNGQKIELNKKDGKLSIKITSEFDDSEVKKAVENYKKNIEAVDDCLFVEAIEEIKEKVDINTFDSLLKKESFNEEEASEVMKFIDYSSNVIANHLRIKINKMIEVYNRF